MAAWLESPDHLVVDLRNISAADLAPLLDEETAAWTVALDWDFEASADLVRRFVGMQALNGFALLEGTRAIGYSYYIREEKKGLIGDLYVRQGDRTAERENALIEATLEALWRSPGVRRVEAQLLLLDSPLKRKVPFASRFKAYPRRFLEASARQALALEAREREGIAIAPWTEAQQDDSARLVAAAYRGHIDSEINDQYRSPSGSRRFLSNIVQYPGCGTFFPPGVVRGGRLKWSEGRAVRYVAGEPGGEGNGTHHADLRGAVAARQGRRIRAAAAVHAGAGGARMPHCGLDRDIEECQRDSPL